MPKIQPIKYLISTDVADLTISNSKMHRDLVIAHMYVIISMYF